MLQIVSVEKQLKMEHKKMGGYYRLMDDHCRMKTQAVVFENRLQKVSNSLPIKMKKTCCLVTFKRLLKTHLLLAVCAV